MTDLSGLNDQQKEAVQILEGPVLVLAGAGSGKTRVVTTRIAYLIENGVPPSKILGVTFTNKAAGEMRDRVLNIVQHNVVISTFHSLGARILRESIEVLGYSRNFTIYDEADADRLLKVAFNDLKVDEGVKLETKPFRLLISQAKNNLLSPDDLKGSAYESDIEELFPKVYAIYQQKLKECNAVDFDDLLFLPVKIFMEFPEVLRSYQEKWPFVLIDEYQDTNTAQYTLIKLLVERYQNLFVVGDPDQSIYSWRGANIRNILSFEKDYPQARVIELVQNYRSHTNILEAANALISCNENRYEKDLWSDLGPGEKIKLMRGSDEREEALFISLEVERLKEEGMPLKNMVVFYRTNAQSRPFEDVLLSLRIPYVIVGGLSFYQRKEIKDILAFLKIAHSSADYVAFSRTINLPKRGIGDTTLEKLRIHASQEGLTVLAYCNAIVHDQPLKGKAKLSSKQKESLADFLSVIANLRNICKEESISDAVIAAIEQTGYLTCLQADPETMTDRKDNLNELIAKASEWEEAEENPTLEAFLEELSLKSHLDEADAALDRLCLMTIHNGKGLEFDAVFMAGMEDNLFPHINAKNNISEYEEERRLCYVGMTRAKKKLYLSYCNRRYLWGNVKEQDCSPFLFEIPKNFIEKFTLSQPSRPPSEKVVKLNFTQGIPISYVKNGAVQQESFDSGQRILHKDFGVGEIREAYEGSMGLTYKIFFEKDKTVKTIVAKYATLSRV
jgi:DNA helicase-2/ATP-dependent DNA helicase PcrA